LEKVVRLGEIAGDIARHPLLGEALTLKGGSALNLCYGPPRRLAVAAGSGIPQWIRWALPRNTGHCSSEHNAITASILSDGISVIDFERKLEIFIPISRSAMIASGRTDVGLDPADQISRPRGARDLAIPSAIWLRAEFAAHKNKMPFTSSSLAAIPNQTKSTHKVPLDK
jgi:hypothetical protein